MGQRTRPVFDLLVEIGVGPEPGFEQLSAIEALQVEHDHRVTTSGIGAAMRQGGDPPPHLVDARQVNVGKAHSGLVIHVQYHLAPGIDHQ